jgi:hypothetical protein
VDVTGIEAVTPCLQSTRLDSIRSIHYFQLLRFPINRGTKLPTCLNHSIRRSWPAFSERSSTVSPIPREAHDATPFNVMKVRAPRSSPHTAGAPQTTMRRPPSRMCRNSGAQRS